MSNTPNFNVDTTRLRSAVRSLDLQIRKLTDSGITLRESREAQKVVSDLIGDTTHLRNNPDDLERLKTALAASQLADLHDERNRYLETLNLDLMEVTKPWIVVDEPLISPSGFRQSDRVYIRTNIAVQFDTRQEVEAYARSTISNLKGYLVIES